MSVTAPGRRIVGRVARVPARLLPLAALLLGGCTASHRVGKFLAPEQYVTAAEPRGTVAQVTVSSGEPGAVAGPYTPRPFAVVDGVTLERPMTITEDGWVELTPTAGPYRFTLAVRRTTSFSEDFRPVFAVTGAVDRRVPNELRLLPIDAPRDTPYRLAVADLANVYAPTRLAHGDLLLLTVTDPEGRAEHYLFREQEFGLHARFGAGVLVRVPLALGDEGSAELSPTLAGTVALGFRPRSDQPAVNWASEQVALVVSVGIGSTNIESGDPALTQLEGAFNAALVGGGVELFRFVSGQVQVNVSAFTRRREESQLALAVGFDAVQFAKFTDGALERLFERNTLRSDR